MPHRSAGWQRACPTSTPHPDGTLVNARAWRWQRMLELAAPAIADRERQIIDACWEAVRSLRGDLDACWSAKHRRWHSAALKSRLVRRFGRRIYERAFPW